MTADSSQQPVGFVPRPGAAPLPRMVAAQTAAELRLLLRNPEQLLLVIAIPALLLVLFGAVPLLDSGPGSRLDFLAPGVIALAVMSTAFTGQAIATGFERRYGVLKRLGATALPRAGLLVAKTLAVLAIELLQVVLLVAVALALGWRPAGFTPASLLAALVLVIAGTAAFSGLALLLAGTLRAEATLAAANLVYVVLLACGGVFFAVDRFPGTVRPVLELLPITALADGLRAALSSGSTLPLGELAVLLGWTAASGIAAALTFRWD